VKAKLQNQDLGRQSSEAKESCGNNTVAVFSLLHGVQPGIASSL